MIDNPLTSLETYQPRKNVRSKKVWSALPVHAFLLPGAITMVVPLLWMLSTAFKSPQNIFLYPPQIIPDPLYPQNFSKAFNAMPFLRAYGNSLYIAVLVTAGALLTSSMAGYGFARLRFRGKGLLFGLVLATMMIPSQISLMPSFVLFHRLGWLDTHLPLIIPPILGNAFGVFLMRQFMMTIPKDLEDAARIDGANPLRIYYQIMLPLMKPALSAVGIFTFMGSFNDFLGPLVYLNSPEKMTVPVMLSAFQGLYGMVQWGPLMAAATVAILPVILVYIWGQRYFIEGIALTGLKG